MHRGENAARMCGEPHAPNEGCDAANQNLYNRAGLPAKILLSTAGSGARVARRRTCHGDVTVEVLPFIAFGCRQLAIDQRPSGVLPVTPKSDDFAPTAAVRNPSAASPRLS